MEVTVPQTIHHHLTPHIKPAARIQAAATLALLLSATVAAESTMGHHTMQHAMPSPMSTTDEVAVDHTGHMNMGTPAALDEHAAHADHSAHAAHNAMMHAGEGYLRTVEQYAVPDMQLLDAHGNTVALRSLLGAQQPVILNFIFTSCTTVCPILSATLAQASRNLKRDDVTPLMVSISIDPQHDTPARLREYAMRHHAGDNWHFLTGEQGEIVALQRAFAAYYGNKLNHKPVSFLRKGPAAPWVRLQGFTTSAELVEEYRALLGENS
jgi:protein SCO1/2